MTPVLPLAYQSMDWFLLALGSAFTLASADAFTKKYLSDYDGPEIVFVRFGVAALLLLPFVFVYPLPPVPTAFWLWIAVLVPLELLAMLLYVLAIRDSPLHLTLPYLAFTPVLIVLTGYLVLGESVSHTGFFGILLVVMGAYQLNAHRIGKPGARRWLAPFVAIATEQGSRFMLMAAAIYSLTSVMSKAAMGYATPESFGPFYFAIIGFVVMGIMAFRRPSSLRLLLRRPGPHLLIGVLMAIMVVTHFMAIAQVEVAYMVSVKRTSLLFGILYGALLFGERNLMSHALAGALMVTGVVLIVL